MADEGEIFNGFGSSPLERNPSQSGKRTKKRWSFHNNNKPNLVDLLSTKGRGQRRMSDVTGVDGVHKEIDPYHISPAQLYSTESGRLFHAGKICIALAGLPGRGKTHLSVSLTRYLRWLGVKTHSFHLGDYRRASAVSDLHHELFMPEPEERKANEMRNRIVDECVNDMLNFFEKDKGQVAIYDAVNALPEDRLKLSQRFLSANIQVLFIESSVTDDSIIMKNMESAARSSPDYVNWDYEKAYKDYSDRIKFLTPYYQEMGTKDAENSLSYIKFINFGDRIELHNSNYGYLINKVVFFLMNSRIKSGSVFFARCYKNSLEYTQDPPLDDEGDQYARNLTKTLLNHLAKEGKAYAQQLTHTSTERPKVQKAYSVEERHPAAGVDGVDENSLVVWTSVKKRTMETTKYFAEKGVNIRHRIQLSQKNPGVVGGMDEAEIEKKFPSEYASFKQDPYHHRFSRAESYHDLAIKIEPLILEMERMSGDILIIADDTVLKVFYGYLMSCSCYDIPSLNFSTDEIIEIRFNAYSNAARVIPIESN
ncbi:putative 6-phosphofructo-2-kinase/fructose-26-bisphosphatase [Meyerozyma sp. JA9]|nr:putative 6-phosphofructo-2-kinase/fructose-26-bisphosphatase [Meyerozyma sp. JA9]